jgi:hypothetical protein
MKSTCKKFVPLLTMFMLIAGYAMAQKTKSKQPVTIPMQPAYWLYDSAGAEFITHNNVPAIHIKNASPLKLKNQQFANGTIEFDVDIVRGFPGISFRISEDWKNGDHFYLRYFGSTSPESRTTLQYAALIDNMSIWDLTDEYQGGAALKIPGWNHIKLVVSGKQMKAYVNDMNRPALLVPALEGGLDKGGIYFSGGEIRIANLVIRPDEVENLSPAAGYLSTYNDTRYLRNWNVSPAKDFSPGKDILPPLFFMGKAPAADLPDSATKWTAIKAEDRGLVNLTRIYGRVEGVSRRLAWLKTTIVSDSAQERLLHLGFSDEVWLFINGQILYVDKNHYGTPQQKFPRGRCTIENATIKLPLQKGKNEILIGLANYFYGWGIIARLDDTEGIHLE